MKDRQPPALTLQVGQIEDRPPPEVPSMVDLWPSANWAEREVYDMYGIKVHRPPQVAAHPALRGVYRSPAASTTPREAPAAGSAGLHRLPNAFSSRAATRRRGANTNSDSASPQPGLRTVVMACLRRTKSSRDGPRAVYPSAGATDPEARKRPTTTPSSKTPSCRPTTDDHGHQHGAFAPGHPRHGAHRPSGRR